MADIATALQIPFTWQPKQKLLYDAVYSSPYNTIGYGGSRGGSKSRGGKDVILNFCFDHPGVRGWIVMRTYPKLRDNHITTILEERPFLKKWYRVGDKEILLPNGSVIGFRFAETEKDVTAMIGPECHLMLVDQAEQFTEKELKTLKSVVRSTKPGIKAKTILTFNPGNIGMAYLKRVFIDKEYREGEQAGDYFFIQAYGWDNWEWSRPWLTSQGYSASDYYQWPELCAGNAWDGRNGQTPCCRFHCFILQSDYGRWLNSLPPALRIGWLLGKMDKFAGQFFDIWNPERHVRPVHPDPWQPRWLGIDWGFSVEHPSCCHWGSQIKPELTAVYRELLRRQMSPKALAQEIVSATPAFERPLIRKIFLSHDAFHKLDERDTVAQQMAEVFVENNMPYPEVGSTDVQGRALLAYTLMEPDLTKEPGLVIDPSCENLIDTIPMVCHDDKNPEKTPSFIGDDPFSSFVYLLTYRMGTESKPKEQNFQEEAAKIQDPFQQWWYIRNQRERQKRTSEAIHPNVVMPWQRYRRPWVQ